MQQIHAELVFFSSGFQRFSPRLPRLFTRIKNAEPSLSVQRLDGWKFRALICRLIKLLPDGHDLPAELVVLFHEVVDFIATVHHRCVVAAAHGIADFWKGGVGFLSDQVHGYLPGEDNIP